MSREVRCWQHSCRHELFEPNFLFGLRFDSLGRQRASRQRGNIGVCTARFTMEERGLGNAASSSEDESAGSRKMLVCIECGQGVSSVFKEFPPGSGHIRLSCCGKCGAVADPYVEHDALLISIDLLLHKPRVYRHLLFNSDRPLLRQEPQQALKFALACVFFDSYLKWISLVRPGSQEGRPPDSGGAVFGETREECGNRPSEFAFEESSPAAGVDDSGKGRKGVESEASEPRSLSAFYEAQRRRRASRVRRRSIFGPVASAAAACGFAVYLLLGGLGCLQVVRSKVQQAHPDRLATVGEAAERVSRAATQAPSLNSGRENQTGNGAVEARRFGAELTASIEEQLMVLAAVAAEFCVFSFCLVLLTRLVLQCRHLACCRNCGSGFFSYAMQTAQKAAEKWRSRFPAPRLGTVGSCPSDASLVKAGSASSQPSKAGRCCASSQESQRLCSGCDSSCSCSRGICCCCCVAKFGWGRIFHALLLSMYGKTGTLLLLAWSEASLLGAYLGVLVLSSNAAALNIILQSRRAGPAVVAVAALARAATRIALQPLLPHRIAAGSLAQVSSLSNFVERATDLLV